MMKVCGVTQTGTTENGIFGILCLNCNSLRVSTGDLSRKQFRVKVSFRENGIYKVLEFTQDNGGQPQNFPSFLSLRTCLKITKVRELVILHTCWKRTNFPAI